MSAVVRIACEEWRQWGRSRLAVMTLGVFAALLVVTTFLTATDMIDARHDRLHQQAEAEQTFLNQPARHPHRMVHYGHYVFRAPPPLAVFDPGVDSVTGQSLFLEGHRQNAAMFADARAQARTGGFGILTPAKLYFLFLPLLLIALGHAVILREREARTLGPLLSQGVSGPTLFAGKLTSLAALIGVLSVPALITSIVGIMLGEPPLTAIMLYLATTLYLCVWGALIVLVSILAKSRGIALGTLLLIWFVTALIVPRIGVAVATITSPVDGKIVTDMKMKEDIIRDGDPHNAADPAFAQLRANLLAEYDVATVEELPINFRGVVAGKGEENLTKTLNAYANRRMNSEIAQSGTLAAFGWVSPYIAASTSARHLAGTDLATHHRFMREAEALRFDFVQSLNRAQAEKMSYAVDVGRNASQAAFDLTRVDPENWKVLDEFRFVPDTAAMRLDRGSSGLMALILWLAALLVAGFISARRLAP